MKRVFDLAIIAGAHLVFAPVFLLAWLAIPILIVLDTGRPVFYRQRRVGRLGREFDVLKFRTMVDGAEDRTGSVWASADDPRVTRVGRILRSTALDELPQVISIVRGDMSLVGPRPERPDIHAEICKALPGFAERLTVEPGLTGLAQVHGRYDSSPAQKLRWDLEYIRCRSLWVDLRLVLVSGIRTLSGRWSEFERQSDGEDRIEPARSRRR